jgi:hypothetical protein
MKWSAKVKINKLQKVKGAQRAEPKPQNPIDIGMQVKTTPTKSLY